MFAVTLGKTTLKTNNMQVDAKNRELWQELSEYGDFSEIARNTNTTPQTIQRIVKGTTPYETAAPTKWVKAIDCFYKERQADIKKMKRA